MPQVAAGDRHRSPRGAPARTHILGAMSRGLLLACVACLVGCATMPPPPPAPVRRTNMDLAITSTTLPNGLRVVRVFDPRAREVHVTMRYAVGAADEPTGQEGVAHLVEHLMFQQVVGAQTIMAKIESSARWFNAFTSYDATTYVTYAPAAQLESLLFVEFVRMNLRCASITESVFEREREVVLQELRLRDQATELRAAINRGIYPANHPYGRLGAGSAETVGALTLKQACAFADAHYGPTNAVLVVSGNIDGATLDATVAKHLARIPKRQVATQVQLPGAVTARAVETSAPIDEDAVLVAWAMPTEPEARARAEAVASVVASYINSAVKGPVVALRLGETRAPTFGVLIVPGEDETTGDVIAALESALGRAPLWFRQRGDWGRIAFNLTQQSAIHAQFAALEDGGDRDEMLATYVFAGISPERALGGTLQALRTLTGEEAAQLVSKQFAYSTANIVVLKASEETRGTTKLSTKEPVHDMGQRRDTDPALAMQPVAEPLATRPIDGTITRTLPNGLRVILMPLTSVPVVDARIVFAAGTGDELPSRRGAAIIAAKALWIGVPYINDTLALSEAGAKLSADAGIDRTTFRTTGLDMHLDYMLAGLRRLVREGTYEGAGSIVKAMRDAQKTTDDEGARTDAWRAAIYGTSHPYQFAGMSRHIAPDLSIRDVRAFRDAFYTPDNATLIIAGKFDPAVANRWIDYLFSDWTGTHRQRSTTPATVRPVSLAIDDDVAQTFIRIAMPATVGSRAERLVATEMLAAIARDVRHQLGASYELGADYNELRRSALYEISGTIDAPRTAEAIELIRARVEQLRSDADRSARAFVEARKRVLSQLGDVTNTASTLAGRVALDIGLGRAPLSDVKVANEVHDLTLANMTAALGELDLARAAIAMRGPTADIDKAYAALGRTPRRVIGDVEDPFAAKDAPIVFPDEQPVYPSEVEDALTLQRRRKSLSFGASAAYANGKIRQHTGIGGPRALAYAGVRVDDTKSIGLRASVMSIDGTYPKGPRLAEILVPAHGTVIAFGAYMHVTAYDRIYGGLFATINTDKTEEDEGTAMKVSGWDSGLAIGLEAGIDLLRVGAHRFGLLAHVEGELATDASWAGF
ncbi:MAG: M16 family metallopeptidase, partial [Kofleriaceae bacterium]